MLAYFPAIYPDELLYSVLARYYLHVGLPPVANSHEMLFGKRSVIASYDLIGSLDVLAERIPADRYLSAEVLLNMTLYPYCVAFEPGKVQARVEQDLREGKVLGNHLRLGLAAFRIGRLSHLRFCAECNEEMLVRYGELYWRRSHQLPSVLLCADHGIPLQQSSVYLDKESRHAFIAANLNNCPAQTSAKLFNSKSEFVLNHLMQIAHLSIDLLRGTTPKSFDEWTIYYRARMLSAGLAKSVCTMNQKSLCEEFRQYYAETLSYFPHVIDGESYPNQWLQSLVRRHRNASHPLYHLLLQNFLNQRKTVEPIFGVGPWPCPNPLIEHPEKYPVTDINFHGNRGRTVARFNCYCGYIYTRWYDQATNKYGPIRFLKYGPSVLPVLLSMVGLKKSLREIGRLLKLDPKTVVKLCLELGIESPWHSKVLALSIKPITNKTKEVTKPLVDQTKPVRAARTDWAAIDSEYKSKISESAALIKQIMPPMRVTLAEIERWACQRGWLGKRLRKLPKSKRMLKRVVETTENFQMRRIVWAKNQLEQSGLSVDGWRIARIAGLKPKSYELITQYLHQLDIVE
ncbi:MAG: TnsD family Tn7-like transposition protein [Methylotenera sp.]|jgi:hypothetical protein|nr:TnsD family Tn7-like transposition protein [Methylotenera sp.]